MSESLLLRIADAVQREHDLILELKGLAAEFSDHIDRMADMTDRLQRRLIIRPASNVVPLPEAEFELPHALRSGPTVREA